jgi:hypothetical protein
MKDGMYEFDPEIFDADTEDDFESIDNWKPSEKSKKLITSEWRKNRIGNDFNQQPDLDDLIKIKSFLKKGYPDFEIMENFGINSEVLSAIKKNNYCAVEGIKLDNLTKIFNEFKKIENSISKNNLSIKYILKTICRKETKLNEYKEFIKKESKSKKAMKKEED